MISGTDQIMSATCADWRNCPLTFSQIGARSIGPAAATGTRGAMGAERSKALPSLPRTALVAECELEIPAGHVQPHTVAPHMGRRLIHRNVHTAAPDGHHELDFVVEI
jgi:hypothetical protein